MPALSTVLSGKIKPPTNNSIGKIGTQPGSYVLAFVRFSILRSKDNFDKDGKPAITAIIPIFVVLQAIKAKSSDKDPHEVGSLVSTYINANPAAKFLNATAKQISSILYAMSFVEEPEYPDFRDESQLSDYTGTIVKLEVKPEFAKKKDGTVTDWHYANFSRLQHFFNIKKNPQAFIEYANSKDKPHLVDAVKDVLNRKVFDAKTADDDDDDDDVIDTPNSSSSNDDDL